MKRYLVIEVACHECGMGAHVIHGFCKTKKAAEKVAADTPECNYFSNVVEILEFDSELLEAIR